MSFSAAYLMWMLMKFSGKQPNWAVFHATGESCAAMYRCRRDFLGQDDAIEI